jgi:hypothetical protein
MTRLSKGDGMGKIAGVPGGNLSGGMVLNSAWKSKQRIRLFPSSFRYVINIRGAGR